IYKQYFRASWHRMPRPATICDSAIARNRLDVPPRACIVSTLKGSDSSVWRRWTQQGRRTGTGVTQEHVPHPPIAVYTSTSLLFSRLLTPAPWRCRPDFGRTEAKGRKHAKSETKRPDGAGNGGDAGDGRKRPGKIPQRLQLVRLYRTDHAGRLRKGHRHQGQLRRLRFQRSTGSQASG